MQFPLTVVSHITDDEVVADSVVVAWEGVEDLVVVADGIVVVSPSPLLSTQVSYPVCVYPSVQGEDGTLSFTVQSPSMC